MKSRVSRKSTKRKVLASGGPWAARVLLLGQGGTMVFSLGEWSGRYESTGVWHAV